MENAQRSKNNRNNSLQAFGLFELKSHVMRKYGYLFIYTFDINQIVNAKSLTSFTFTLAFADVSKKPHVSLSKLLARFAPWSLPTTLSSSRSHLLPTSIIGTWNIHCFKWGKTAIRGDRKSPWTKGNNSKNIQSRVMVLVHDTSSECALQKYEVSLKYL